MEKIIPKILPGFMELLPEEQIEFNKMLDTIREVYESFGFLPLDTPVLEYANILLAKAGGETEKQIYRFKKGDNDIALRFDLTVPLARYVAERYNDLAFPFKRYQIGKVYRGERPQRGRFREFYQCDIDIINEDLSLMYDAEIPCIIYTLFKKLAFGKFTIRINNRKILNGFFEEINLLNKAQDILKVIDKLEKIGLQKVNEELKDLKISEDSIQKINSFILINGTNEEIITSLKKLNLKADTFNKGVEELEEVIKGLKAFNVSNDYYKIDLTIARGLDYYTGTVYETKLDDYPEIGSICSGGRYDELTKYYTDKSLEGIGISIGLTRLFYQLKEKGLLFFSNNSMLKALVIPFSNNDLAFAIKVNNSLRSKNINSTIYYENKSIKAKIKYANRLGISYVIFIGEEEQKNNKATLKNMETGEQSLLSLEELLEILAKN